MIRRSKRQPDPRDLGRDSSHQLERLAEQGKIDEGKTGDVATGVRKADDNALINGVVDYRKDDWDPARGQFHRLGARRAVGDDDIRCKPYKLGCVVREAARIAPGPAHIDPEIIALRPSQLPQRRPQRRDTFLPRGSLSALLIKGQTGAHVFIPRWEKQGDGTWQVTVVVVGRDGITPPM
jgi:hypothetical protein